MGRLIVFAAVAAFGWYAWRSVTRGLRKSPPPEERPRDTLVRDPETGDYHISERDKHDR